MSTLRRIPSPLLGALLAFALAVPVFAVLKAHSAPHYAISHAQAIRVARADPEVARDLRRYGYDNVRVSPIDEQEQRVSFFNGDSLVLHAAVGPQPRVTHIALRTPGTAQSGSAIVNFPPLLILLTLLFVLATATVPLVDVRNLDVLALASFTLPVWLINQGLIDWSVWTGYVPLGYLAARCMWIGLRGRTRRPRSSLYWHLTRRWPRRRRVRVLKQVVAAMAVLTTMVTLSSSGASDVAFAAVAGATDILHGVVPYGHIPDFILHGDTYPLLTYVIYIPAAAVLPVTDFFSDPEGALFVTWAATLLAAGGLHRIATRAARETPGDPDGRADEPPHVAGLRTALAWLAFPPVLLTASSGANDVVLAASLVVMFALLAHRRRSVVLLGVAAWIKVIPVLALPIWLARLRRRAAWQSVVGLAALSAVLAGWIAALGGPASIGTMLHALSFQFQRGSLSSLWEGFGIGWLQPAAEAALVAAVAAATLAVRREEPLRHDLPRLAALLAGISLLAQFGANYWSWAYLPWAFVPMLLWLIGPTGARMRSLTHAASTSAR